VRVESDAEERSDNGASSSASQALNPAPDSNILQELSAKQKQEDNTET